MVEIPIMVDVGDITTTSWKRSQRVKQVAAERDLCKEKLIVIPNLEEIIQIINWVEITHWAME